MAKKKPAGSGRPKKYHEERIPWTTWLDAELAEAVDKKRGKLSRPELLEMLLKKWLGR